jgi:LacI family transcriptional regulator, gluconate utilization system Gnt-I transcriptional repressor
MADVAARAGVGTITVSRALRTPQQVSAEVRERVRAAIEATGYVPNLAAGTLKSQRSRMVAAIVPTLRSAIFAETVDALADGLRDAGLQLLIAASGYSVEAEAAILRNLLGQQPVAVVLTGTQHAASVRAVLRERRLPVVETWDLADDPIDRAVGFSNFEAARRQTLALAARGHRRIAFVGTSPEIERRAAQRQGGYLAAIDELGLAPDVSTLDDLGVSIASGERAVAALLDRAEPPQAAFFVNDIAAFGAVQACQRLGVRVPQQLAIAGFGDFELARASNPALTTVRIPGERIGRTAARLIADRLAGLADDGPRAIDLGFELVSRASA